MKILPGIVCLYELLGEISKNVKIINMAGSKFVQLEVKVFLTLNWCQCLETEDW
jgi:hypothetical protein